MFRKKKTYGRRSYKSGTEEAKRLIYIITEGYETEYQYFCGLKNNKKSLGIDELIEINPLKRGPIYSGYSHLKHLLDGAKQIEDKENIDFIFNKEIDKIWIIFDRDYKSLKKSQISKSLKYKDENSHIELGLTNPRFELWLLLHHINIKTIDDFFIKLKNDNNYLEKLLEENIDKEYNKSNIDFSKYKDRIRFAIENEKELENNLKLIVDNFGCNIGTLIETELLNPER